MHEFTTTDTDSGLAYAHPKRRIRAIFHGHLLADTGEAVVVREAGEPDRYFFPRGDVSMEFLTATDFVKSTNKGEARFFTLHRDAKIIEHAAWSYEHPADAAEDLRSMLTFDLDVVTIEEGETDDRVWDAEAERMSEYIRHTDSGSGRSQDAPWQANVAVPSENLGEDEEADEDFFTRGSPT